MAYVQCTLNSSALALSATVNLYFPTDLPQQVGNEVQGVLTLLHGYTNCSEDWAQMTAAARYAADNGLVLVIPSCQNSFYHDMVYGSAWRTFVTQELPAQLGRMFHLHTAREKNWIAGLSMGGYGALYLGLSRPDLYAGCASFSGCVDLSMMLTQGDPALFQPVAAPVFGAVTALPRESDLHYLMQRTAALPKAQQPKILLTNGRQDLLPYGVREQNEALHATCTTLPLEQYRRMEWDGVHEWSFWDRSLVYAIDYFLNNGYAQRKHTEWNAPVEIF